MEFFYFLSWFIFYLSLLLLVVSSFSFWLALINLFSKFYTSLKELLAIFGVFNLIPDFWVS